jgi:hypothetical protein
LDTEFYCLAVASGYELSGAKNWSYAVYAEDMMTLNDRPRPFGGGARSQSNGLGKVYGVWRVTVIVKRNGHHNSSSSCRRLPHFDTAVASTRKPEHQQLSSNSDVRIQKMAAAGPNTFMANIHQLGGVLSSERTKEQMDRVVSH